MLTALMVNKDFYYLPCKDNVLWSISQKVVSLRSVVSVNFNQSKAWKSHLR